MDAKILKGTTAHVLATQFDHAFVSPTTPQKGEPAIRTVRLGFFNTDTELDGTISLAMAGVDGTYDFDVASLGYQEVEVQQNAELSVTSTNSNVYVWVIQA